MAPEVSNTAELHHCYANSRRSCATATKVLCFLLFNTFSAKLISATDQTDVFMQPDSVIKGTFDESQGFNVADFKYARIIFSTRWKQGILMQIRDERASEYLSITVNNNGGITVVFHVLDLKWEANTGVYDLDLADGQKHEVVVNITKRQSGSDLEIHVDNYPPRINGLPSFLSPRSPILNNPKYIYIGNNDSVNTFRGFKGCIYSMQVNNIYPLKTAFQEPRPSYISLKPEGTIKKGTCSSEEMTQSSNVTEISPRHMVYVNAISNVTTDGDSNSSERCVGSLYQLLMVCFLRFILSWRSDVLHAVQ